jgi:hypothetical protein
VTEYVPQYLLQPLKYEKQIAEESARAAAQKPVVFRMPPSRPCERCDGRGCYTEAKDGSRRPYSHLDFKRSDTYVASCPVCHGGGRIPTTTPELRHAYQRIRQKVCEERGFDKKFFDKKVSQKVSDPQLPAAWYEAARFYAASVGVETTGFDEKDLAKHVK